jgi:hypothetical protein
MLAPVNCFNVSVISPPILPENYKWTLQVHRVGFPEIPRLMYDVGLAMVKSVVLPLCLAAAVLITE